MAIAVLDGTDRLLSEIANQYFLGRGYESN